MFFLYRIKVSTSYTFTYLDLGVRIETGHRLNEKTTLTTRTSLLNRRHDRDSLLRGQVSNLSFGINHVLTPTLRVNASVGLSRTQLKSVRNSNRGRSVNVGMTNLLEGGLSIGGSFGIQWDDWGGDWFPEVRGEVVGRIQLGHLG